MAAQTKRDYYEVLGVARTVTQVDIKSAYRKAALKWHPDRNPDHKETAGDELSEKPPEAYSVLADQQKRAAYDRHGHAGVSGHGRGKQASTAQFSRDCRIFFGGKSSQLREDIFGIGVGAGRGRGRSRAQRGADLRYDMRLSFEEAAAGNHNEASPATAGCLRCVQSAPGAKAGTGTRRRVPRLAAVTVVTPLPTGVFRHFAYVPELRQGAGAGDSRRNALNAEGRGRIERTRTIDVKIPPGVDSQTRIRVPGEKVKQARKGGPPGDLYIVLDVKDHPFFERRGADAYCTVPISIAQAALGAEITVPGLAGEEKVSVPEGTQTGAIIRLRAKGLSDPHGGGKGDLYISIRVVTPTKLTREQKRMLQQLGETIAVENRPAERNSSFFEKVKDIFG